MKRKPVEDRIYELKETVAGEYFKVNPLKTFPDDFLSKSIKKELAGGWINPKSEYLNPKQIQITEIQMSKTTTKRKRKPRSRSLATIYRSMPGGVSHQVRHRPDKIDFKKVMESYNYYKELESKMPYELVLLPSGKLKLTAMKRFGIGFDGSTKLTTGKLSAGEAFMEFDYLEMGKYLLYARKKNQYIYKVPRNEIVVKRAVQKYEKYIRETRSGLVKAFMEKGANKKGAEGLAGLVMGDEIED